MVRKVLFSVGYFVILFYVVLLIPVRRKINLPPNRRLKLVPVIENVKELFDRHKDTWTEHFIYFFGNIFVNIVLFLPFSFIAILVFRMSNVIKIALLGCLLSIIIELLQDYTGWGVTDVDDVLLNTTGAIAGYYLCQFFQKRFNYL